MMFGGPTNEADSIRIIHRALDDEINFIDTANVYNAGASEIWRSDLADFVGRIS